MNGQRIAYLRVSTTDQNLARQEKIKEGADKVFEEKASAKDTNRPQLQLLLEHVREGDEVIVDSIDRLARSITDLFAIIAQLKKKGVVIHFIKEDLSFNPDKENNPFQNLQFTMLGAFAQFEREISRERQREGIEKAKAAGKYKGRKRILTDEQVREAARRINEWQTPKAVIARELGVSRATLHAELQKLETHPAA